jgi:hypothetical protein
LLKNINLKLKKSKFSKSIFNENKHSKKTVLSYSVGPTKAPTSSTSSLIFRLSEIVIKKAKEKESLPFFFFFFSAVLVYCWPL